MLKNKKKVMIMVGIATVLLMGSIFVFAIKSTKQEIIELEFKKEIVVEKDEELTAGILIEKSNADKVTIKDGATDKIGKIKATVTAVKGKETKDFSTEIKVEENDKDSSKQNEKKKKSESDEVDENSSNKTSKSDKKGSNSSGSNSSGTENKNTFDGNSGSSDNLNSGGLTTPSQPQQPVQPEFTEAQFASQVYTLINNYRTGKGFSAFSTNGTIQSIANLRANDMAQMGYASHYRPDGTAADAFWVEANYGIVAGGENVFGGSLGFTPDAVVNSFIESPGHERLFVADYNQYMGVGVRYAGGQVYVSVNFQQ